VLNALIRDVEVIQTYDRDVMRPACVLPRLSSQPATFDAFFTPAPVWPVINPVEFDLCGGRLLWRRRDSQRLDLSRRIVDLDELLFSPVS
jgi:hypothetical protein